MRDNWLSNRVFQSYDAIVDHCCYAWKQLVNRPWRVMSIGLREWAMGLLSESWYKPFAMEVLASHIKTATIDH